MPIHVEVEEIAIPDHSPPPKPFSSPKSNSKDAIKTPPDKIIQEKSAIAHVLNSEENTDTGWFSYVAQDYAKQILEILNEMRRVRTFCDAFLVVNDAEIPAHKTVLAASSGFFRAMFANKKAENPIASVTIQGIDIHTMNMLVEFAYTGSITVGRGNVKDLLPAASSLEFLPVRDACCDFLERHCNPINSVGIRYFALLQNCPDLVQRSEDYIARNFTDVAMSEEFLMLSYSQVSEMIDLQKSPFRNEQVITLAIFSWINHDPLLRTQYFKDLFKLIKLDMLSAPFILSSLVQNELVKNCKEASDAVLFTMTKLRLLSEEVSKVTLESVLRNDHIHTIVQPVPVNPTKSTVNGSPTNRKRPKPHVSPISDASPDKNTSCKRNSLSPKTPKDTPTYTIGEVTSAYSTSAYSNTNKCKDYIENSLLSPSTTTDKEKSTDKPHKPKNCKALFVVGGACNVNMTDAIKKVEYYDPGQDKWFEAAPLNKSRSLVGVTVLKGSLYAVGGFDGISPIDSVECYNPGKNVWQSMGRMISARRGAGVTTLKEKIYAVGGFDGTKLLSLSECYHQDTNSWQPVAPLNTCRFALGAAELGGRIYAVGGFDGQSHLSTVEMYDPSINTWSKVTGMSMSRYAVGVTSLNDCIFAVGGLDGTRPLSTVERYDPRDGVWRGVADMDTQRAGVDVTVVGDSLYAVGGILGSSPLQSVEKYEIRMNMWTYVAAMSVPRVDAGAGSVDIDV